MRMDIPFSSQEISDAIVETVARNGHESCYIRPLVFRGSGALGLDPNACPVEVMILTMEWGRYLGAEAIEQGIDVMISSWRRMAPDTFPALAKLGGQYINSQFITTEAKRNGFDEGLALDINGYVSEGAGENVFVVIDGVIYTPPLWGSVLPGITRDSVMRIARDLEYDVREQMIAREMLYMAEEIFLTGTAAEISAVRSVDRLPVGDGARGPITKRIQDEFFGITSGRFQDKYGWLTPAKTE
jgi:branched-chain amino acid aminotransferase